LYVSKEERKQVEEDEEVVEKPEPELDEEGNVIE